MARQKAHWCITIKEECYNDWSLSVKNLFDQHAGKYINCKGDRIILPYDKTQSYYLAVGFKEKEDNKTSTTHWHCMISCMPGKTATAGRIRIAMNMNNMNIDNQYIQPMDTNPMTWMKYCNKEGTTDKKSQNIDGILRDEFNALKKDSIVAKEGFLSHLCELYGATWITKNKTIIDTFCSIQEQCYAERIVTDRDDNADIITRVKSIISSFHDNILKQLKTPNHFYSTAEAISGVSIEDVAKYITFIALLPYLFQRAKNAVDYIPGLYFWGDANAGKSFIFQLGRTYKTIATDSVGIAKFKLETCESAFLLDDIRGNTIDSSSYISTLRQLTLGASTRIKVHSETKQVKGFVAVTSNEMPYFLSDYYDEKNKNAWLRRFIVLQFTKDDEMDDLIVNGNEFEHTIAQQHLAPFMLNLARELKKIYGADHRICKSINLYKRHLRRYIDEFNEPVQDSIVSNINRDGPSLDTPVGYFDEPKLITAANLIVVDRLKNKKSTANKNTNKRQPSLDDEDITLNGFDTNGKRIKLEPSNDK